MPNQNQKYKEVIEEFRKYIARANVESLDSPEKLQGYVEQFLLEKLEEAQLNTARKIAEAISGTGLIVKDLACKGDWEMAIGDLLKARDQEIVEFINKIKKCTCTYTQAERFWGKKGLLHNKKCGKVYQDIIDFIKK